MNAVVDKRERFLKIWALVCDALFVLFLAAEFCVPHTGIAQLAMAAFCAAAAVWFFLDGKLFFDRWFLIYALFVLWAAVGYLAGWAADGGQARAMLKTLLVNGICLFCLYQYLMQRRDMPRALRLYLIAAAVFVAYVAVGSGRALLTDRFGWGVRINPNLAGLTLLPAAIGALCLWQGGKKWPYLAAALLAAVLVVLTGSRMALLGLAVAAVIFLLWSDQKHIRRNLLLLLGVGALGAAALLLIPQLYALVGKRLLDTAKAALGVGGAVDASAEIRAGIAEAAMDAFFAHPWTGVGADCVSAVIPQATYAHNNPVELLACGGVPWCALWYAGIALAFLSALRVKKKTAVQYGMAALVLAMLPMDLFTVSYYERVSLLPVILLLAASRIEKRREHDGTAFLRCLKNPALLLLPLCQRGLLDFLPDGPYLKILYRACIGKKLDLAHPVSFNAKLNYLKIHDRRADYAALSDKYAVRSVIADVLGEELLVPLLGVWDRPEEIDFDALPDRFVLKATHDSGGVLVCRDKANFDRAAAVRFFRRCMKKNYARAGREHQYEGIVPRVMAETFLSDGHDDLTDYKVMCFSGTVRSVFTCTNRNGAAGLYVTFFDTDWNRMPFIRQYPADPNPVPRPASLERMIALSEQLCGALKLPFARIDFYEVDGKPYIGEITLRPGSGLEPFDPEEWDEKMGAWIDLSPWEERA